MNKEKMINELDKILNKLEDLQLAMTDLELAEPNNSQLDYADNTMSNAYDNLCSTIYHLKMSK